MAHDYRCCVLENDKDERVQRLCVVGASQGSGEKEQRVVWQDKGDKSVDNGKIA